METPRRMRSGLLTIASLAVLTALALPAFAGAAGASPIVPLAGGASQQWAYGGQHWWNNTVTFGNGTFTTRAYFGEQVVLTATNTSSTTREFEGVRTVGESFYAQYCRPNCSSAVDSANLSLNGWQQLTAFVNLTTAATVYEMVSSNGSTTVVGVPALGINNASSSTRGDLTESYALVRGTHAGAHGALDVNRKASMAITFSPALGLVPWNVTKGTTWNSSSTFDATGGWNDTYTYTDTLRGITTSSSSNSSGTVSHSGTEGLRGRDLGNVTLRNGMNATVIVLGYLGPFAFGDGLFLTTPTADLFGGMAVGWSSHAFASAVLSTSDVDLVVDHSARTVVPAAASATASVGSSALGAASVQGSSGLSVGGPAPPDSGATVQEQPESPAAAQQASQCLVGGCTASSSSAAGMGVLLIAVAAVAVVAVAAGVGLVLVRRPRRPSGPVLGNPPS
jgi:hypothetical protein